MSATTGNPSPSLALENQIRALDRVFGNLVDTQGTRQDKVAWRIAKANFNDVLALIKEWEASLGSAPAGGAA